jgi:hypothetical protein
MPDAPHGGADAMDAAAAEGWSRRWDSNPRPSVYETDALPLSYFGARAEADSSRILHRKGGDLGFADRVHQRA